MLKSKFCCILLHIGCKLITRNSRALDVVKDQTVSLHTLCWIPCWTVTGKNKALIRIKELNAVRSNACSFFIDLPCCITHIDLRINGCFPCLRIIGNLCTLRDRITVVCRPRTVVNKGRCHNIRRSTLWLQSILNRVKYTCVGKAHHRNTNSPKNNANNKVFCNAPASTRALPALRHHCKAKQSNDDHHRQENEDTHASHKAIR